MPPGQHERQPATPARGRLADWLIPLAVAVLAAVSFTVGTRYAPRPVAPVASQVIRTECKINTTSVQAAVEELRTAVNARRQRKLTPARFEAKVAAGIPVVAQAVRSQGVTCKTVP